MTTYTIKTDAFTQTVEANSMDEAVRNAKLGYETADEYLASVDAIDGAWAWIDTEDGPEVRKSSEHCYDRMM